MIHRPFMVNSNAVSLCLCAQIFPPKKIWKITLTIASLNLLSEQIAIQTAIELFCFVFSSLFRKSDVIVSKSLRYFCLKGLLRILITWGWEQKEKQKETTAKSIHFSFVVTVKSVLVRYDYDDAWKQYIYTFKPSITHKIWIHNVMFFPQFLTI